MELIPILFLFDFQKKTRLLVDLTFLKPLVWSLF